MDDDDFLAAVEADNANTPVAEEPVVETPLDPTPEPAAEPEKVEPEPVLELTTDEIVTPKPDAADGRLLALLEERDRRKAAEAERDALRAQQVQPPVQMPDPYEDPEGFAAAQRQVNDRQLYETRLFFSEQLASVKHGEDTVKAAKEWGFAKCDSDPYFNAKVAASQDPVGFVVSEYKREEIASKVDLPEFEQFQAWKAAQGQLQQQGGQPPPPNAAPSIPTPSLASAPSAGSILTAPVQSDDEIFDEVIPKR